MEFSQCVLGALVSHKTHVEMVAECLRCMSILGTHGEVRMMIAKTKGVKRILSAMDRHQQNLVVQECG